MKDPTAKVVQFFYRERFNILTAANGTTTLQAMDGLTNVVGPGALPIYDPDTTYAANAEVGFRQANGVYLGYTSLVNNNKGKPPGFNPTFWTQNNDCNGTVHQCYPLTTSESFPNWVPDAEPPNDLYLAQDTQLDCDGIQIFDSPGFFKDPAIEQRFTGITLDIVSTTVNGVSKPTIVGSAIWQIVQHGNQDLQYLVPSLTGPPDTATITTLRAVLIRYGFTPDF